MSFCIEKILCPCEKKSRNLQVFGQEDGSVNSWCYSCETFIADPYGEPKRVSDLPPVKIKTQKEIDAELAEIDGYQTLDVDQRRIKATTLEYFEAKTSVSEKDGQTVDAIYWPAKINGVLKAYYVKPLWEGGHGYYVGDGKGCDPFGWDLAKVSGARTLIITEGPEDMACVDRIFERYGNKDYHPAVISLPRGAGSASSALQRISKDAKALFKEVVFCFDNDEKGKEAVRKGLVQIPDAYEVTLPYKDANECTMQGAQKAAYDQLSFRKKKPKTSKLIFGSDIHEEAKVPPTWGDLSWPFPKFNNTTRGIRYGDTIYIGAAPKSGKGEVRDEIAAHFMREHNIKIIMASFEAPKVKTYKMLAGKLASRFFHDPKKGFDSDAFDEAGEILKNNLAMVDIYQRPEWSQLKDDIIAAAEWGAKAAFIDPITNFTNGMDPGAANTFLQGMAQEVSELSMQLGIVTFLFCHLKASDGQISQEARAAKYAKGIYLDLGNCAHGMGGTLYSDQFAGSRAMARSCNLMIGLSRNKDSDLPVEVRNTGQLVLLEEREFGETGKFPIYWDENSGRFTEL